MTKEEKDEMLEALGLDGSGLDKLIQATYDILGLATYFTVGKDEVRAWTFRKGMTPNNVLELSIRILKKDLFEQK